MHKLRTVMLLGLAAAVLAGGCGDSTKKDEIWVYHTPDFYRPELKRLAVIPFSNHTGVPGVAEAISDKVATNLTNNGTYEVYTRSHLADIFKERDAVLAGILSADEAMQIGQAKAVQALVCGDCYRYEAGTQSETRYNQVPVWGTDADGYPIITGWQQVPYLWTRNDAYVECNVVLIDTGTGRQIAAVNEPTHLWAEGSPPKRDARQLIDAAHDDQVGRIFRALDVTRTRIKLKGDVLKIALGLYDNEYDWEKKIAPADESFLVVVQLPPEADRNDFKITIVPDKEREVLAEDAFTWDKQYGRMGRRFAVQPILEQGGCRAYRAKLYSGPEPIATYKFEIVEERK
ncbi:MAG: hypothetical protein JSU68_11925 [Phycisphaerales bacterium]|nr:MAG: hypothetical protein JSU68_11925 [Phycisphaerales bacterium]